MTPFRKKSPSTRGFKGVCQGKTFASMSLYDYSLKFDMQQDQHSEKLILYKHV